MGELKKEKHPDDRDSVYAWSRKLDLNLKTALGRRASYKFQSVRQGERETEHTYSAKAGRCRCANRGDKITDELRRFDEERELEWPSET